MKFSVIIPTFNEMHCLSKCIAAVRASDSSVEVIVVDGGSRDGTLNIARREKVKLCHAPRGRGSQLNAGAQRASGDILLFLHADTQLPVDAFSILRHCFQDENVRVGTFAMGFDVDHWLLDFYSRMTQVDSLWTRFGDQCIVVRKTFFHRLGGFPNWPLFEDVQFLQEARRYTTICYFPAEVITSAERFIKKGPIRQTLKNLWLLLQYLVGVSPTVLSKKYES